METDHGKASESVASILGNRIGTKDDSLGRSIDVTECDRLDFRSFDSDALSRRLGVLKILLNREVDGVLPASLEGLSS